MGDEPNKTENTLAESSTASTDGKTATSFEAVAEQFAQDLAKPDSSGGEEGEEGAGLKKTPTEEAPQDGNVQPGTEGEETEESPSGTELEKEPTERERFIPRERFDEVNTRLRQYEPLAQRQYALEKWWADQGLTPQDFEATMQLAALKKKNPTEYLARIRSEIDYIEVASGQRLPKDLQEEVEMGTISEARARELAQYRLKATGQETTQQQTVAEAQRAWATAMGQTLSSWAQTKAMTDPDFKPKAKPTDKDGKFEDFLLRFQVLCSQRVPQNFADVTALAEQAYEQTNEMVARYRPTPPKKKVLTAGSTSTTPKGEPKTADDVLANVMKKYGIA